MPNTSLVVSCKPESNAVNFNIETWVITEDHMRDK